jgi:hypothetical protein
MLLKGMVPLVFMHSVISEAWDFDLKVCIQDNLNFLLNTKFPAAISKQPLSKIKIL